MNKILVVNDKILEREISKNIVIKKNYQKEEFSINEITIEINESENLSILFDSKIDSKLIFNVIIKNNVNSNIYILTKGENYKINYRYELNKESNLKVIKYNNIKRINEMIEVNLNDELANINYTLKTIGKEKESYDYRVFHNKKDTYSNIKNNSVNLKGVTNIQISGSVYQKSIGCVCNQNNRIINLTENKCEIRPILYIDTDDVTANHSALIGNFEDDEIFYLNTMGISKKDAYNLLIKGFLISDINNEFIKEEIEKDIKKYWR